jgi:hypothetical protein
MRDKGKDENDEPVLCGGSYEKIQAVCDQGTIGDPDTEGNVKGIQSMGRNLGVSYDRLARGGEDGAVHGQGRE